MCRKCLKIRLSIHRYTTVGWSLARHRALVHPLMLLKQVRRRGWRRRRQSSSANLDTTLLDVFLIFLFPFDRTHNANLMFFFSVLLLPLYVFHILCIALCWRYNFDSKAVWRPPPPLHNTYRRQWECRLQTDVSRDAFSGAGVRRSLWLY